MVCQELRLVDVIGGFAAWQSIQADHRFWWRPDASVVRYPVGLDRHDGQAVSRHRGHTGTVGDAARRFFAQGYRIPLPPSHDH